MGFAKKNFAILSALAFGWSIFGCVGLNPAGPPAPLAEIPSALSLPESVAVDTSEVGGVGGASLLKFQSLVAVKDQVQNIGGEFFEAITFGFNTNQLTDAAVAGVLGELSQLNIPLNPVTRFFQADNAFLGTSVKIDFADFDFEGKPAACTGCTCPTGCDAPCRPQVLPSELRPVCYRIWNDPFGTGNYVPLMAGFITQLRVRDDPATEINEENAGNGSFRIKIAQALSENEPPTVVTNVGANYSHRDPTQPLDKSTEYFLRIDEQNASHPPDATVSFVRVEQKAVGGASPSVDRLVKTIRESINQPVTGEPNANSTFQYIARYRTDFDFWSGTFQDNLQFDPGSAFAVPPDIDNFANECAQLSTAIGIEENTCEDVGIDVTNVPALELVSPDDPRILLPDDFPAVPTF